ncbi:MAG: hypothetical protein LQ340_004015 [Diploschistes diacapsis]|nr:MAG: hypothetical protein LQ340_004015 [Diploschistes diacapsis]
MPDVQSNGTPGQTITPSKAQSEHPDVPYERRPDGQPRFQGCSKINAYEVLGKLGEGTFGLVHKARQIKTGQIVALKKILMHNEKDGFPITALREIKLLKLLSHPNILKLEEMAVETRKGEGKKKAFMYMVTPYMDHDLSGLLENPAVRMTEPQIKCYMLQLLEGVRYLHSQKILHRDMKAANLLINNKGILQIADFGLARPYDESPPQAGKGGGEASRDYTTLVVTRWYRPPELLLQLRKYTTAIDMWGVGCVFGEMFKKRPILAGKSDLHQIQLIFALVGSPTEENMPGWSELPGFKKDGITSYGLQKGTLDQQFRDQGAGVISLLAQLLVLDWRKRINAIDALEHPYFKSAPFPARPADIPQFEESHELDRRKFRDQQAAPPPAPAGGSVGMGPEKGGEWGPNGANGHPPRRSGPPPRRNDFDNRAPPPHHHRQQRAPPPYHDRDRDLDRDRDRDRDPHNDRDRRPAWDRGGPPPHRGPYGGGGGGGPNLGLPPRPNFDASWSQLDGPADPSRGPAPPPRHQPGRLQQQQQQQQQEQGGVHLRNLEV